MQHAPGAVALDASGELLGYIIGAKVPNFRSTQLGVHVPEWANGAIGPDRFTVLRRLYEYISTKWVDNGCFVHAVTAYAHDEIALETWFRTAFGMICGDAVRELVPVSGGIASDIEIRQAGAEDIDLCLPMIHEHQRYYPTAPLFMPLTSLSDRAHIEEWLGRNKHVLWLALDQGEPIGYFESSPSHPKARHLIFDEGTCSICGAFVRPGTRKRGVGAALLTSVIEWAKENGHQRCAVDYETHNIHGSSFWRKHFAEVAISVMRHIDERVSWGHSQRRADNVW
jgi:GNAT superfamily N-acetyltransferase